MLTAEIKINDKVIARIRATQTKVLSDRPGDFIGDRATVCEYDCVVENLFVTLRPRDEFTIVHDRRFGWQGLLNKITDKVTPMIVETMSLEE